MRKLSGKIPILGICLGHQCIGEAFGVEVTRAGTPMHGRASTIHHDGSGIFAGLPQTFRVGRYHSLIVSSPAENAEIAPCAWSEEGEVMAVRHRAHPTYGVQFHPGIGADRAWLRPARRVPRPDRRDDAAIRSGSTARSPARSIRPTAGCTLGDGVFDTLVSFRRMPFAAERHLARLVAHAEAIGIALDPAAVRAGWDAVIGEAKSEHVILRTTVTRGVTARGLWPKTSGSGADDRRLRDAMESRAVVGRPVELIVSTIARNAGSPASRLKTIGYLDNILAAREAADRGADDALLLNAGGKVACSTIANLFALSGGRAPHPTDRRRRDGRDRARADPGDCAQPLGIETAERSLEIMDLFAADEVFLTNSVRLVSPVQIARRPGRSAAAMPDRVAALLAALAERIRDEHGFDPRARLGCGTLARPAGC